MLDASTDAAVMALRIRSTGIAPALLVALDDWASRDDNRRDWLFEVARQVEPNPTSQRIRDPKVWNDKHALEQFARSVPIEDQSVPFLLIIARKIGLQTGEAVAFLKRVQRSHPRDFETNFLLAYLLVEMHNPTEGARYYQAAIAIRPTDRLGRTITSGKPWPILAGLKTGSRRCKLRCVCRRSRGSFGIMPAESLLYLRRIDEAMQELRRACELEPQNALFLSTLGRCLAAKKNYDRSTGRAAAGHRSGSEMLASASGTPKNSSGTPRRGAGPYRLARMAGTGPS